MIGEKNRFSPDFFLTLQVEERVFAALTNEVFCIIHANNPIDA